MPLPAFILLSTVLTGVAPEQSPPTNPKAPHAIAPRQTAPNRLTSKLSPRFSNAKELTLSMGTMQFMLDLDTGATMNCPAQTGNPEQNQMDISPIQQQPYEVPAGLDGYLLQGLQVESAGWDATASDVESALASRKLRPLRSMQHDRSKAATFFFRTRNGTDGILQIARPIQVFDATQSPSVNLPGGKTYQPPAGRIPSKDATKGLLIRYKTVQR